MTIHTSPRMKYATGAMGQYLCLPPYSSVLGEIPGDQVRGVGVLCVAVAWRWRRNGHQQRKNGQD